MHCGIRTAWLGSLAIGAFLAASAAPADAQTLRGRVLEAVTERPISGASLSLVDPSGGRVAGTDTDELGRFSLKPPRAGEFVVEIVRIGYERALSPLIAFSATGEAAVDFELQPLPIGLEGLEVEVESEADRFLAGYGLSRAELGNRWIDRARIEAVATALRAKDVLRWAGVSGVYIREDSGSPSLAPLCVGFWRAKSLRSANPPCAITFLNGVRIDPVEANQIAPEEIESMAVLTPVEATFLYGTEGSPGAVLLWTRRGGRD